MTAIVEIAVQDPAGARVAIDAGADRIELCQALVTGGLTPSLGLFDATAEAVGADRIAVLVRPRPGGYVHDADEVAVVAADVATFVARGVDAVVVGALRPDGTLDTDAMAHWVDAAGGCPVVLHRAIDSSADPLATFEAGRALGIRRVLTSGGARRTADGLEVIAQFVAAAGDEVEVVAGGGVRAEDVPGLLRVGAPAIHLSARGRSAGAAPEAPHGTPVHHDVTDPALVAAVVREVRPSG